MTKTIFADRAQSTLASAASINDTSITIQSGDADDFGTFDTDEILYVVLENANNDTIHEVVTVTGRSGAVLTCSALTKEWADAANTVVTAALTKESLESLLQAESADQELTGHAFSDYQEKYTDHGTIADGGTLDLDWDTGPYHKCHLDGDITIDIDSSTIPGSGDAASKVIEVTGADSNAITWAGNVIPNENMPSTFGLRAKFIAMAGNSVSDYLLSYAGGWDFGLWGPTYLPDFSNRVSFSIDHSKIDSDLTHFPVPVILNGTDHGDIFDELDLQDVDDDFTGNDGDAPNNFLWDIRAITSNATASIQNNKYRQVIDDNSPSYVYTDSKFLISGDFDCQIDMTASVESVAGGGAEFYVLDDTSNYGQIYLNFSDKQIISRMYLSGDKDQVNTNNSYTSLTFRIKRVGSTWYAYYDRGAGWVQVNSRSGMTTGDVSIRINTRNWTGYPYGTIDWDNFQVNSGTIVWPENTNPNRKKIAFTKSDGETQLFGEIEQWDQENEKAVVWVSKSDWEIDADADTRFYLYYDSTADDNPYIGDTNEEVSTTDVTEFDDDFTGDDGDAPDSDLWDTTIDAGTVEIASNLMRFSTTSETDDYMSSKYKLSGDFDVQIDYAIDTAPSTDTWQIRLDANIATGVLNTDDIVYVYRGYTSGSGRYVGDVKSGGTSQGFGWPTTSDTAGKLRVKRVGSTASSYYWNGSSWTQVATYTSWTTDDVIINILARSTTTLTYILDIDNFQVNSGTIKYTPAERVWDENFAAVYHMAQDPSGTAPQLLDSTSNDNDGTSSGSMTSADLVDGGVGKALDFDGTDDHIDLNNDLDVFSFIQNTLVYTIEAHISLDDLNSRSAIIGNVAVSVEKGFALMWETLGDTYPDHALRMLITRGISNDVLMDCQSPDYATITDNNFHNIAVKSTAAGSNTLFFVDGAQKSTTYNEPYTSLSTGDSTRTVVISDTNYSTIPLLPLNGKQAELRISDVARSDAWIKADYHAQNNTLIVLE